MSRQVPQKASFLIFPGIAGVTGTFLGAVISQTMAIHIFISFVMENNKRFTHVTVSITGRRKQKKNLYFHGNFYENRHKVFALRKTISANGAHSFLFGDFFNT